MYKKQKITFFVLVTSINYKTVLIKKQNMSQNMIR